MKIVANSGSHLWIVLWRTFKAFEKLDRRIIDSLGIEGFSDFAVLGVLAYNGSLPVNTIGRKVMLSSGSTTTAIDRLEKNGWVVRRSSVEDRRVVEVHLTNSGKTLMDSSLLEHSIKMDDAISVLEAEEREELVRLLKKLGYFIEHLNFKAKPN